MTTLTWLSVDARTGTVLADLPGLEVDVLKRTVCQYETATASLLLAPAPDNWVLACREGGAVLILLSDDVPIWGGLVTSAPRGGDVVTMSLATMEAYLDRRYVGDVTYAQIGQNAIVADLIARYIATGPLGGLPIRVAYSTSGVGTLRDRAYLDADDKTVYSVLTELAAVEGGPEWTIEFEWSADHLRITPVLWVGDRVGRAVQAGMAPAATFDMPGCVIEATVTTDYSNGAGANVVMATSTADGDVRPESPLQVAADDGRPTFEHRYSPSTSITEIPTLTAHAARALTAMAPGARSITLTATLSAAPPLGLDWVLGDDVGYRLGGTEPDPRTIRVDIIDDGGGTDIFTDIFTDDKSGTPGEVIGSEMVLVNPSGRDTVPAFPGGLVGVARCIGWELSPEANTLTPILSMDGELTI